MPRLSLLAVAAAAVVSPGCGQKAGVSPRSESLLKVAITSPVANQTFAPGLLTVKGTAFDPGARPTAIEVSMDDGEPSSATALSPDFGAWSVEVNALRAGNHTLTARATNANGKQNQMSIPVTILSGSHNTLYDDFSAGDYVLVDGESSPNGKWLDVYRGDNPNTGEYGTDGTKLNDEGRPVFFETQPIPTGPSQVVNGNQTTGTSSSLVLSTKVFNDFTLSLDVRTVRSMRSPPNEWEVAWMFFRYGDVGHHYYFFVGYSGWELGKKDVPVNPDGTVSIEKQYFFKTGGSPVVRPGTWTHWDVTAVGNRIAVSLDGTKLADIVDDGSLSDSQGPIPAMSSSSYSGQIGMYNEDASVEYANVAVTPL